MRQTNSVKRCDGLVKAGTTDLGYGIHRCYSRFQCAPGMVVCSSGD